MKKYTFILIIFISLSTFSQNDTLGISNKVKFFIGEQVINADGENERQIIQLWQNYISAGQYGDTNSPFWFLIGPWNGWKLPSIIDCFTSSASLRTSAGTASP